MPRLQWIVRRTAACLAAMLLASSCARLPMAPSASRGTTPAGAQNVSATAGVIAQLLPGVSGTDFATSYGASVIGTVPELRLVLMHPPAGTTDADFARRLAADPRIEFAEPNVHLEAAEARQSTIAFSEGWHTWGDVVDQGALTRIHAADAQAYGRGGGVLVGILDTGIDLDHPALEPVLDLPGIEPGAGTDAGDDRAEYVDSNDDGIVDGALGHGTHVAGIVHAVAPDARLLAVRVLDSDGVGDAFRITRGLVLAVERGISIANLSLGMSGQSRAVLAALDYAVAAGVVVVAPTGNAGSSAIEFPSDVPEVVAVAGTDANDDRASFSNYGVGVDVAAPAVGILSTYWDGGYAVWSGTSMAAPFATGTAALLYAHLGARTPALAGLVQTLLLEGARPLAGVDPTYGAALGAGRVDAGASVSAMYASASAVGGTDPLERAPRH
ncbi:MAG TPA: S8 family serine peptidase [Candidatus Eisenbacteria bacterium]|nr:S8 family serine peptidase [Candidatus Eisenbacteria bacterium]